MQTSHPIIVRLPVLIEDFDYLWDEVIYDPLFSKSLPHHLSLSYSHITDSSGLIIQKGHENWLEILDVELVTKFH